MAEKQGLLSRTAVRLVLALTFVLAGLAFGPASAALAQPPHLTLDFPEGTPTNNPTPQLRGTTDDSFDEVFVVIERVGGGGRVTLNKAPVGEEWSISPAQSLQDGEYTAQATQTNGEEAQSNTVTFTVDTVAPEVHITAPANGAFVKTSKPTISGTGGNASGDGPVALTITPAGGSPIKANVNPSGGAWSYTPSSSLPSVRISVRAEQADAAGNQASPAESTFTVKAQGPALTLNAVPSSTNSATPTFSGGAGVAAGDDTSVTVRISGHEAQVAPVSGSGWSVTAPHLADGTYTVEAEQADEAGNQTKVASAFTVDTVKPEVRITAPANGAFVNILKPTISGTTLNASGDGPVALTITPPKGIPLTETVSGAKWSYTPSLPESGAYTVRAEQKDAAGNIAEPAVSTFTVKTQGPAVTLTALPPATNNPVPGFSGAAGVAPGDLPVVTVKVYAGSAASGTPVQTPTATVAGASWSAQAAHLPDGTYTVQAEQSDEGGTASKTPSSTFTVDTVLPLVSLVPGSTEKHTATPKFEGSAGTASGDLPTVTLNIYAGPSATGTPVRVTSVVAKSGKWSAVPSAALRDGTYTAQAEQADQAGNHGLSLPASTFTISSGGPVVTLTPISSQTNNASPSFSGSVGLANGKVKLQVYSGSHASGNAAVREATVTATGSSWSAGPVAALADGTYTAIAEESDTLGDIGVSNEATFTVDSVAPAISLTSPANGSSASGASQIVEGAAGTAPGDAAAITVRLAAGTSIGGQILQTRVVPDEGGHWRVNFEGLSPGSYTTQAEQSDAAANSARSQAATFTLTAAAVSSANPTAAFTWVPSAPRVGQTVSLVSSSSAATSPIIGYAWDVAGTNAFLAGASVRSTVFSTSGNHVVHLSVSAADGRSSVATATIPVLPATYALMRPFPIVHIASSETRSGIRLRLLSVRAPSGSRISVTCHNRGCPVKSQQKVAAAAATGVAGYTFRKFQRTLRAGVVLEIRVSAPNSIGKYTRLTIRKGRLPQRLDQCLTPGGAKTMACPS